MFGRKCIKGRFKDDSMFNVLERLFINNETPK